MSATLPLQAGSETVQAFFHPATSSVSYILQDPASEHCAILDPVLDYDPATARTGTQFADGMLDYIRVNDLSVDWILETHAHADHITAAQYLHKKLGAPVAIGEHICQVQYSMKQLFNLPNTFACDGSQFDHLLSDGERFKIGSLELRVMHTPGHTPACVSYLTNDSAFVGDTLFMPDYGTARADFPGGSARALYQSIQRLFRLPDSTRLYCCHDYQPGGRDPQWHATVMEQKRSNIHIRSGIDERGFVQLREARDRTLDLPALILPALQVNIRAGHFPPVESNGVSYLKIPVDVFR